MAEIRFEETSVAGLIVIHPQVQTDERGSFIKTFETEAYGAAGLATTFAEEYHTESKRGVVRGMHFQIPPHDHDKVVFCTQGAVMDAVVDLRNDSPTYRRVLTFDLGGPVGFGLHIPRGCAHGFCALSETAVMWYRTTSAYSAEHDQGILWSSVPVRWPSGAHLVSERDGGFPTLDDFVTPFRNEGE